MESADPAPVNRPETRERELPADRTREYELRLVDELSRLAEWLRLPLGK